MEFFTNFLTLRGEHYALVLVACAELVARTQARTVVLAHLSAENNTPRLALEAVGATAGVGVTVEVAPRSEPGRGYEVP